MSGLDDVLGSLTKSGKESGGLDDLPGGLLGGGGLQKLMQNAQANGLTAEADSR